MSTEKKKADGASKTSKKADDQFEELLRNQREILKRIEAIQNEVKTLKGDICDVVQDRIEATTELHTQQLLRKLEKIQTPPFKEGTRSVTGQKANGNPQPKLTLKQREDPREAPPQDSTSLHKRREETAVGGKTSRSRG
ncbi:hypothetical protein Aduo_015629 [Ancylostoma duodenale]